LQAATLFVRSVSKVTNYVLEDGGSVPSRITLYHIQHGSGAHRHSSDG